MYTKHDQRIDRGSAQESLGLLSACFRRLSQFSLPHLSYKVVPVFEQKWIIDHFILWPISRKYLFEYIKSSHAMN